MSDAAVEVQRVSKRFRLYHEKYTSLKERVIHAGRIPHEDLWALQDVEFSVQEGETVGILGRNGSGKSTLLKCVCGVLQPTSGQVVVRGKLAGLLELGAGFQQDLSGRENIYLNGSMLGMSKKEVDRVFDDIVAFAELEQFIDNQVKFYSSGMYVRLGFAVAVNVDPDVLVVDEVLAVGDERFQRKCMDRIKTFQREGRTIVFVSHSPDQVRAICDRAVVLNSGKVIGMGPPGDAVRLFREILLAEDGPRPPLATDEGAPAPAADPAPAHPGDPLLAASGAPQGAPLLAEPPASPPGPAEHDPPASPNPPVALATEVPGPPADPPGSPSGHPVVRMAEVTVRFPGSDQRSYLHSGDPLSVRIAYDAAAATEDVVFVIEVRDDVDNLLTRTDTEILGTRVDVAAGRHAVEFSFPSFPLLDGAYRIFAGIQGRGGILYDWREPAAHFEVANPGRTTGMMALPIAVAVDP